jgi:hypothetical protein
VALFCNPASGGTFSSTAIEIIKWVKNLFLSQQEFFSSLTVNVFQGLELFISASNVMRARVAINRPVAMSNQSRLFQSQLFKFFASCCSHRPASYLFAQEYRYQCGGHQYAKQTDFLPRHAHWVARKTHPVQVTCLQSQKHCI